LPFPLGKPDGIGFFRSAFISEEPLFSAPINAKS
jgi:hypothetical protein